MTRTKKEEKVSEVPEEKLKEKKLEKAAEDESIEIEEEEKKKRNSKKAEKTKDEKLKELKEKAEKLMKEKVEKTDTESLKEEIKAKKNSTQAKAMQSWYSNIRNRIIDRRAGQIRDLNNKLLNCLIGIFPRSERQSGEDLIFKIAINDMNDCH